jgi:hypothetical protein
MKFVGLLVEGEHVAGETEGVVDHDLVEVSFFEENIKI